MYYGVIPICIIEVTWRSESVLKTMFPLYTHMMLCVYYTRADHQGICDIGGSLSGGLMCAGDKTEVVPVRSGCIILVFEKMMKRRWFLSGVVTYRLFRGVVAMLIPLVAYTTYCLDWKYSSTSEPQSRSDSFSHVGLLYPLQTRRS